MTPEQQRALRDTHEAVEKALQHENRRLKEIQDALDSKVAAEHNHRIVALEIGIVGVVIPLIGSQSGIDASLRIAGGALLGSTMVMLAWDVFAPAYRRPVLSAAIDLHLASCAAASNRSRIMTLQSYGFDRIAADWFAAQRGLDDKQLQAVGSLTTAWGEVQKFDTRMRVVAYGLLLVGLGALLWAVLFMG